MILQRHASLPVAARSRLVAPAFLDFVQHGRRDKDRRIGTQENTQNQNNREVAEHAAAEDGQREQHGQRRGGGQGGTRQGFVDRTIEQLDQIDVLTRRFLEVFANAVENDDCVIERITDDGEHRGYRSQRYFHPEDGDDKQRNRRIVNGCDDGGQAEAPLESDRQVNERRDKRHEYSNQRLSLQFGPDLRTYRFGAYDGEVLTELSTQGLHDDVRCIAACLGETTSTDQEFVLAAELRDFRSGQRRLNDVA